MLRILLSISLLMSAFLILSSVLQYYNSRGTVLENQKEANKRLLSQVAYNINYMSEQVKTLTMSMYFDVDMVSLMNSKTIEIYDLYPKINRLIKIANSAHFVHSIIVYNAYNGCYYSTRTTLSCEDEGMGQVIDRYLTGRNKLPKLKFVPMSLGGNFENSNRVDLFSYFMYDSLDDRYAKQSTLIVNLTPEWLFDNIDSINRLTDHAESSIFIVDGSGKVLNPGTSFGADRQAISGTIADRLKQSGKAADSFTEGAGKSKKIISYMTSEANEWMVVNIQSYDAVLGKVGRMKTTSVILIAVFLLLSAVGSIIISLKLYKPIENMLKQIRNLSPDETRPILHGKDELSFISNEYRHAIEGMQLLKKNQETQIHIMKTYHLRKLVTDSSLASFQELQADLAQSGLKIDLDGPMIICVLKLDNYSQFQHETDETEKKLIKFAFSNITEEIVSAEYRSEVVDMRNDHLILLVNIAEPSDSVYPQLAALLGEVQQNMMKYYKVSLTAALSEPFTGYGAITEYYGQTMEYSLYRLIYGKMAVIAPAMLRDNLDNQDLQFSPEMERRLAEAIKSNDLKQIDELLTSLMQFISRLHYNNMIYSLLHMIATIHNVVREINNGNVHQVSVDLQSFQRVVLEQETLEEIRLLFDDLFKEIAEKRGSFAEDSKNRIIADTIREIIEENYKDLNLSLQSVSSIMRMSTAHTSKIFRQHHGISVADYITEIRLDHSLKLLENNDNNIADIMEKVGFANRGSFFKLFKKRYGTTPKEYRIKKIIE